MSAESRFLIFAIEHYRSCKGLSGRQVADLFQDYDVYRLIRDNYFLYHIESPSHMVEEIDRHIAQGVMQG